MSRNKKNSVGVIGLGIIGSRVAATLRKAGHEVFVWNRSPRREPNFLGSAAEVARLCPVLQLFVPDDKSLLETITAIQPELSARHLVIAHPSISPETMRTAEVMVQKSGAKFLEAPFTGSKNAAQAGQLIYYIGGELSVLETARPILEVSSKSIVSIGRVGDASVIKLATNMITASVVQTLAEALALTEGSGVSPTKLVEALESNANRSPVVDMKLASMVGEDYTPHFALVHMLKDLTHAMKLAEGLDIDLPTTRMTAAVMQEGVRAGWGDFDFSVVARHYFPEAPIIEPQRMPEEPTVEPLVSEVTNEPISPVAPAEIKAELPSTETHSAKPSKESQEHLPSKNHGDPTSDLVVIQKMLQDSTEPKAEPEASDGLAIETPAEGSSGVPTDASPGKKGSLFGKWLKPKTQKAGAEK